MITLRRIRREFTVGDERVVALRDIDLQIDAGEYLSIMGPSGSGKSTLLNVIGLLDQPDSGDYLLEQESVAALSDARQAEVRRHKIGFVFQFFHLVPRLSAAENIELPLILAGIAATERKQRVNGALEAFSLTDRAKHRPDQLSGGQRQRVAIARATVMQPHILLADEPTGNLDRHSGQDVVNILENLSDQGITLIVVTHEPELGQRARRLITMVDGTIADDRPAGPGPT